ncbi:MULTISPECIES: M48 family metallopeptidase [unclassified Caulobacter]|jgi:predicted Zn-dependent protease|uniref:M48 family metallopeptidase n=1 Tax=unclassified Caulobacter TaxID=2648921 RepID=UPI000785362B|nr:MULTISPECIES: M48 family metallopeptidase [unclassified Caulobacter]AZS22492.1 M48 family peptidase [Caulobacter sp. FWC26]
MTLPRLILPLLMAAAFALGGCAYNADLGRDQLLIVNDNSLAAQGEKAWADALRTSYISKEPRKNARVQAVGQRVITAAGLAGRPWEYAVFLDEAPNAFVLPGGHVGVTVGLLTLVENDDQLAAVIGHEAGHVVARHAAERVSQETTSKVLLGIASAAAGKTDLGKLLKDHGDDAARYGVLLPFSRKQELEADKLGVDFMQRAGYRPREAVKLWRNMQALDGGKAGGELGSTHPSDAVRIQELERYLASKGW